MALARRAPRLPRLGRQDHVESLQNHCDESERSGGLTRQRTEKSQCGGDTSRRRPALPYGADRRLGSGHGTAGDDVTMQDIDGIARYWESELALAGSRETRVPTIARPIGRTWIWSDLHLGDRGPLEAFDRPFADVPAMNRHLLARWRQRVQPGDTIICLGDVAHPDAWRDRRLVLRSAGVPGRADPDPRQPRRGVGQPSAAAQNGPDRDHSSRARRAAAAADASAAAAGAGRLRERARARTPEAVAEQEAAHQRERGAVGLPAREAVRHQASGPPAGGRTNRPRAQHQGAATRRWQPPCPDGPKPEDEIQDPLPASARRTAHPAPGLTDDCDPCHAPPRRLSEVSHPNGTGTQFVYPDESNETEAVTEARTRFRVASFTAIWHLVAALEQRADLPERYRTPFGTG